MVDPRPSHRPVSGPIADRIRRVVGRMAGRTLVADHLDLVHDLGFDAMDKVEFIVAVELSCRIDLPAAEVAAAATVGDLIALAEGRRAIADRALREAIEDLVAGLTAAGQAIDIETAARVLSEEHPEAAADIAAMSEEIRRAIAGLERPTRPGSGAVKS